MDSNLKSWAKGVLRGDVKSKPKSVPSLENIRAGNVFASETSVPVVLIQVSRLRDVFNDALFMVGGVNRNPFYTFASFEEPINQEEMLKYLLDHGYRLLGHIAHNYERFYDEHLGIRE
jgi:hypothetical protein